MEDNQSDEEIYYVENILNHKFIRGKRYLLIKWMGYKDSENSWEPAENINPQLVRRYDNIDSESDNSEDYQPKSKQRKVGGKNKKKRKSVKGKAGPRESTEHPVEANEDPVDANQDPAENGQDPVNQENEEEYVDPADAYKEDLVGNYLEDTTNSKPLENVNFDDVEASTSREYQEANLSEAPTEKAQEQVQHVSSVQAKSCPKPKRRIKHIDGWSNMKFLDDQPRLNVLFEGESKPRFIRTEKLRYEYPQELIDFFERATKLTDKYRFNI